jgi:hypothetical protein
MPTTDENDTGIVWQDPPARRASKTAGTHLALVAELMAHRNQWALVRKSTASASFAMQIKKGVLIGFEPAGSFESRTVTVAPGRYDVYARYVGEQS